MADQSLETRVSNAIDHLLSVIDRRGLDNVSAETREAYHALDALQDGLKYGSVDHGTAIVFYTP